MTIIPLINEIANTFKEVKNESRKSINLIQKEVCVINENITLRIKNWQTINHLYISHRDILDFIN